jgi:hypothetical protein
LTNYWIFKVKDDSNEKYALKGIDIYRHRMKPQDEAWGIKEHAKNRRKAANVVQLESGDRVVFYLCGQDGHCFLGAAKLKTGFPLVEIAVHKDYLDWSLGVKLRDIEQWDSPVQIKALEGRVSFFAKGEKNWGSHLQGAVTKIPESDYRTINDAVS